MKKIIFATAMMLTVGTTSVFANKNDEVNNDISTSFHKEFSTAKEVKWQKEKNFSKATFSLNNQIMYAYYSEGGELIGVVRNILSDKLPINLLTNLKKNYSDYWISDLFEMASEGQSSYYITLETSEETMVLKSDGSANWTVYKRSKKSNA